MERGRVSVGGSGGGRGGKVALGGIGGVVVLVVALLLGGDPGELLSQLGGVDGSSQGGSGSHVQSSSRITKFPKNLFRNSINDKKNFNKKTKFQQQKFDAQLFRYSIHTIHNLASMFQKILDMF